MRTLLRLPVAARNPVSLVGIAAATAMAMLFLVLLLLDAFGYHATPYLGLVLFVAAPAAFVAGRLLIPIGIWLDRRRLRRSPGPPRSDWPVIDLAKPRHRTVLFGVLVLTVANVVILSMAAYGGVHYMETAEFCGQVCHTTMEPQFATTVPRTRSPPRRSGPSTTPSPRGGFRASFRSCDERRSPP